MSRKLDLKSVEIERINDYLRINGKISELCNEHYRKNLQIKEKMAVATYTHGVSKKDTKDSKMLYSAENFDYEIANERDHFIKSYDDTVDRAKKEQDENSRPEIDVDLTKEQLAGYDTVFFGFPVWWYDIPMPMYTFLDSYDFTGKTIIPFLSHEGSSNGGSAEQTINEHARGANVRFEDALSIRGGKVDSSEQDVRDWVDGLGFGK